MIVSRLEADLIRDEGWRDRPYKDSLGFLTIGVGHNLDASGLCKEAIIAQLRHDIDEARMVLDRIFPGWRAHPDSVQEALQNLAFNLGGKLAQFNRGPNSTLGLINRRLYLEASKSLLRNPKWVSQVGKRAHRIAALIRDGNAST